MRLLYGDWWAIVDPLHQGFLLVERTRREAIAALLHLGSFDNWRHARRIGWHVVKVRVEERLDPGRIKED